MVVVKVIVVVVIGEGVSGNQRSTAPRLTISASATRKKESGCVSCVCVSKKRSKRIDMEETLRNRDVTGPVGGNGNERTEERYVN